MCHFDIFWDREGWGVKIGGGGGGALPISTIVPIDVPLWQKGLFVKQSSLDKGLFFS